jgi:fructokinase
MGEYGFCAAAVTLGERGAYLLTRRGGALSKAYRADARDTSGAGDTFWSGFLYSLLRSGISLPSLDDTAAEPFLRFANAAASVCVERRGAIPALPTLGEVMARMERG